MSADRSQTISSEELASRLERWFAATDEPFPLTVTGGSMLPFVAPGRDTVYLERMKVSPKKGDVVLFRSENGNFVLHRIKKTDGTEFVSVGDALSVCDKARPTDSIAAVCRKIVRKGVVYTENSLFWRFFANVWINNVFIHEPVIGLIGKLKRKGK